MDLRSASAPPPLPPDPPPPTERRSGARAAASSNETDGVDMPAVSVLLVQEAQAWRALAQLHQGVAGTARALLGAMTATAERFEATREAAESREYAYCSSLTTLVSQCDLLSTEALRLRTLRKARATTETHVLQLLLQAHSDEALSTGHATAGQVAASLQALVSELGQASTSTRSQIAQLRTAMRLLQDDPQLRGELCVGVKHGPEMDADATLVPIGKIFDAIFAQNVEVTDETLVEGLAAVGLLNNAAAAAVADGEGCPSDGQDGQGGQGGQGSAAVAANDAARGRMLIRRSSNPR